MTPPAPTRMLVVCTPTRAISTPVADEAVFGRSWCSACHTRLYRTPPRAESRPHTPPDALAVALRAIEARSSTDIGIVTEHCPSRELPPPPSPPRHRSSTPGGSRTTSQFHTRE